MPIKLVVQPFDMGVIVVSELPLFSNGRHTLRTQGEELASLKVA